MSILIEVKEPTEYILVHTNKLAVTSLDVHQSSGGEYSLFKIDKVWRNNVSEKVSSIKILLLLLLRIIIIIIIIIIINFWKLFIIDISSGLR